MSKIFQIIFVSLCLIKLIAGHGMLLEPVNRGSRWRYDESAPINFEDNQMFCGGLETQWTQFDGKCGLCGDSYGLARPRPNELGGKYGEGVITGTYKRNGQIPVSALLTANHDGHFEFNLCNLDKSDENESCFEQYPLQVVGGSNKYKLPSSKTGYYNTTLIIPSDVTCKHCVLQWTYVAGNGWGWCDDAKTHGEVGCGPQEHFRTCSDITIN